MYPSAAPMSVPQGVGPTAHKHVSLANILSGQAELANRLIDVVSQTRAIADLLRGPEPSSEASGNPRREPSGALEQADLTLGDLHGLVSEINAQVDRIRGAVE